MEKIISQQISDFLGFLSGIVDDYKFSQGEVKRLEDLTMDYMHKLELQHNNTTSVQKLLLRCANVELIDGSTKIASLFWNPSSNA